MSFRNLAIGLATLAFATPVAALECGADLRMLEHDLLAEPICVPAKPERIAFTMEEIIPAYILGGESAIDNWYFQSFREKFPGIVAEDKIPQVDITNYQKADVEGLALADPQMIVSFEGIENNAKAAELAPFIQILWKDDTTWRDLHQFMSYLLEVESEGQAMLDGLDARMEQLKSDLGDTPRSFAIARAAEGDAGAVQVFTAKNFGAVVLQQAGMVVGEGVLTPEAAKQVGSEWNYQMSAENLEALDVDHFFLLRSWSEENEDAMLKSPLWAALPMVQENRVIKVPSDGEQFIRENIAYAHLVIDLVYENVLGKTPTEAGNPNPFSQWLAN